MLNKIVKKMPTLLILLSTIWLVFGGKLGVQMLWEVVTHSPWIWGGMVFGIAMTSISYQSILNTYVHETSHLMVSTMLGNKVTHFNATAGMGGHVSYTATSSKFAWVSSLAPYVFLLRLPALLFVLVLILVDEPLTHKAFCFALGALITHSVMVITHEVKLNINSLNNQGNDFRFLGAGKSVCLIILLNLVLAMILAGWLLPHVQASDISNIALKNLLASVQYISRFL